MPAKFNADLNAITLPNDTIWVDKGNKMADVSET
jgi:hypothetical protein